MQLYLHIPFCKSKCRYCDFNSYACRDKQTILSYINALNHEGELAASAYKNAKIDTVYVGGGTPSLIEGSLMWSVLNTLACHFDLESVREWSIECNPESLNEEKLKLYRDVGINRLSIGVQSLKDENLRAMGRLHSSAQAIKALELAGKYFDNISADLIVGLPYDTEQSIQAEVNMLSALVSHLSMYELSVEERTSLAKMVSSGKILLPDDDRTQELFDVAYESARCNGFERYEVSNFAREGKISHHNYGYWTREEYLGLGAGAHSFIKTVDGIKPSERERRYANFSALSEYIEAVSSANEYGEIKRAGIEELSSKDIKNEYIMLGLRTTRGVQQEYLPNIPSELESFFKRSNGYISLNDRGMSVMNSILTRILEL